MKYLLSDASTAFSSLTDDCSSVARSKIVQSELLLNRYLPSWVSVLKILHGGIYFQLTSWHKQEKSLNSWNDMQEFECRQWIPLMRHNLLGLHSTRQISTLLFLDVRKVVHAETTMISPHERDDETNPGPFDHVKLLSWAIFHCQISSWLIHEVAFFPLASSIIIMSDYQAVLTNEQWFSRDQRLRGTSVNQRLIKASLHLHTQSPTTKLMNLTWVSTKSLDALRYSCMGI